MAYAALTKALSKKKGLDSPKATAAYVTKKKSSKKAKGKKS